MSSANAFIRRETIVSVAINSAFSLLFFLIVFGRSSRSEVWGVGNYVFDFLPQGFMVAAMSTLVPGLLAAKALACGTVAPLAAARGRALHLLPRTVITGLAGAGLGVAGASAILGLAGIAEIASWPALVGKLVFGAGLAALVTPIGLRAALSAR